MESLVRMTDALLIGSTDFLIAIERKSVVRSEGVVRWSSDLQGPGH